MGLFTITNKNTFVIANEMDDVENVDVRVFFKIYYVRSVLPAYIRLIEKTRFFCPKSWYSQVIEEANAIVEERLKVLDGIELPHQLTRLLESNLFKKEQTKLLKGVSVSADQLGGLFVQAGSLGYKFSNYRFKGIPKEYSEKDLPTFIYLKDDGNLDTYGSTSLSEGQLKDFVIRSKFIVARILDDGKNGIAFIKQKAVYRGKNPVNWGRILIFITSRIHLVFRVMIS